uniref:Uncharacterized protein n=1 Tax=Anopheles braziliensis TaxID=58242 RepID=A0A2M3ZLD3_9DIPT
MLLKRQRFLLSLIWLWFFGKYALLPSLFGFKNKASNEMPGTGAVTTAQVCGPHIPSSLQAHVHTHTHTHTHTHKHSHITGWKWTTKHTQCARISSIASLIHGRQLVAI